MLMLVHMHMKSFVSKASVLLATEPLFAAVFASYLLHEALGWNECYL